MKRVFCAAILALSILSYSAPTLSTAQTQSQLAEGRLAFTTSDGISRFVEFSAAGDGKGSATGAMTFNDTSRIPDDDNDGDPPPRPAPGPTEFYIKAEFDTMTVEKNRAVMGGLVRESSHKSYVGRWVQLVVEDNAENPRLPDHVSWSFCRQEQTGWVPSDNEVKDDRGAYLSWWATDAERKDDVGIPSRPAAGTETPRGCRLFTLASYDFDYINSYKWEGDIVVRP